MPSPDLIEAAINSKSIHSKQSQVVIETYKKAYLYFELPFPSLNENDNEQKEEQPENINPKVTNQIIRAYFQGQLLRITRASEKQGIDIKTLVPTPQDIDDAAQSGDIASPQSQKAIQKIQQAYKKLDIPFHPPIAP